jgi:hypothetical protein
MVEPSEHWNVLRALRASPPARAGEDKARRTVFAAALEQAEQFLTAAAAVGYATKPVQLFYALSQAGRAIAAARAEAPWEILGHGAKVKNQVDIATTTVKPDESKRGAIKLVARATRSEMWEGPITLRTLWGSLPELPDEAYLTASARKPLEVENSYLDYSRFTPATMQGGVYTSGGLMLTGGYWQFGLRVKERPSDPDEERALVEKILAPYPKAAGWSIATGMASTNIYDPNPSPIFLEWVNEDEHGERTWTAPTMLTEQYDGRFYFRPGLGESNAVPSALITWWGVLLALSSLARYEPVAWRLALDVDSSPFAWALEQCLRLAERRIPELVLQAVTG